MSDEIDIQVLKDKIDELNKQAWELRVSDSPQAHLLSKEAFILAEGIEYTRGKAEGYRTFAFSLIRLSKHHEALEYCGKALRLFELFDDLDGQASINCYYGAIQRSLGNYAASLEFHVIRAGTCHYKLYFISVVYIFNEARKIFYQLNFIYCKYTWF